MLGTAIVFSASALNGFNPRFRWDFGDGTTTGWSSAHEAAHQFTAPGVYQVTVTAVDDRGIETRQTFLQAVHRPLTAAMPTASTSIAIEQRSGGAHRAWVVNPDTNTVSAFDLPSRSKVAEITVGNEPRTVAVAPNGTVWVVNKRSQSISVINAGTFAVQRTIGLPRGSQPFGIAIAPNGAAAYVALEATGQVMRYNTSTYGRTATLAVGQNVRHVSVSADGTRLFVSRFVTPPLPGEHTVSVQPRADTGGELVVVDAVNMTVLQTVVLAHSDKEDNEVQGRGVPNYLGAAALSPDGTQAWDSFKQDNVLRGALRDGTGLNFQSTVRAVSSRVDLALRREDLAGRIDHDNASLASAAAFDPRGVYLFVALETSREVASSTHIASLNCSDRRRPGSAGPRHVARRRDLVVDNFMDRTIGVYDLQPLLVAGTLQRSAARIDERTLAPSASRRKSAWQTALLRCPRPTPALDRYMSCATCHNDGGHDGRVWDLTGFGEGLRNTVSLRGRSGTGQPGVAWRTALDQQLRRAAGLRRPDPGARRWHRTDDGRDFFSGTRSQPLGDRKTGPLARPRCAGRVRRIASTFDISPYRAGSKTLSADATAGRDVFAAQGCGTCHAGTKFSGSGDATLSDIGSIKPSSGSRLYGSHSPDWTSRRCAMCGPRRPICTTAPHRR